MFFYVFHYGTEYIHLKYPMFFFILFNSIRLFFFKTNYKFFLYFFFSFTLIIIHLLFFTILIEINFFKFLRYYFFCMLFFSIGFLSKDYIKLFFNFLVFTTLLIFILGLIVFFSFPNLVSVFDYGHIYRLKFFFGEPSALGPFCGILCIYALKNNNYLIFLIVFVVLFLSYSVINFIIILSSILYCTKKKYFLHALIFLLISILAILMFKENSIFLSRAYTFYEVFYNSGLDLAKSLELTNKRSHTLLLIFSLLEKQNLLLIGLGLNQFEANDEIESFSLLHHFLLSFGIPGIIFILFFSFLIILKFKNTLYAYFFPFVIYALINSAQGLLLQGVWFLALACFLQFSDLKKNYK